MTAPASSWEFTVPLPVKPLTGNSRTHWSVRAYITREIRTAVAIVGASERIRLGAPKAASRRAVELTYVRPPREACHPLDHDHDQVVDALKPVIDGLVDARWLTGDRPNQLDYAMPTQTRGERRAVLVTITATELEFPVERHVAALGHYLDAREPR